MIRYVTNKVIINLKWRKCNNFFKPLGIKGNIKYKNSLNFLLIIIIIIIIIISFYFKELYSDTA